LGVALAGTSAAAAVDCPVGVIQPPLEDPVTITVPLGPIIDMIDPVPTPSCNLSVDLPDDLPAGLLSDEIAVYQADYRGFINEGAVGEIGVVNAGRSVVVTLSPNGFEEEDFFFSDFAGSNAEGTSIDSSIKVELLSALDGSHLLSLDTIDYVELARATTGDLQASADVLAVARTGLVTHLNGTFDLLLGAGSPFDENDQLRAFGAIGSITLGVNGRKSLGNGFSLQGGAAYSDQSSAGASVSGALFSGSLRYLAPGNDFVRPFAEGGLKGAPHLSLSFSRDYETSVGTASVTGSTDGSFFGAFLTGGVLVAPDPSNEVVFSATLAEDWLRTAAYEETLDKTNLFAASVSEQGGTFTRVKAGLDWTLRPLPELALTFSGALGHTFAHDEVETGIAFAGTFDSAGVSESFVEYGARAGYDLDDRTSIGAFVRGVTGAVSGTHLQFGGDVHVSF
jgi:hypothetical protein